MFAFAINVTCFSLAFLRCVKNAYLYIRITCHFVLDSNYTAHDSETFSKLDMLLCYDDIIVKFSYEHCLTY